MLKDIDIRINKALYILANSTECTARIDELESRNVIAKDNIIVLLVERNLSVQLEDVDWVLEMTLPTCRLSKKGAKIINKGGWLKHLERERVKTELLDRKEKYDFNLSKWKHNTFWWFFWIAIIGFLLSIFNFIYSLSPSKELEQQKQQLEKVESELAKLHTSISIQQSLDSLHKTKVLTSKNTKEE